MFLLEGLGEEREGGGKEGDISLGSPYSCMFVVLLQWTSAVLLQQRNCFCIIDDG